jgi:hypothetical protein
MSAADEGRSIGTLVAEATSQVSELMRDEITLIKTELKQDIQRGVMGGMLGIVAAVFAVLALLPLTMALGFWLTSWLNVSVAVGFLLAGAAYLLVTVILVLIAMVTFKRVPQRDRGASVRETVSVLSGVKPHPRPKAANEKSAVGDKLQV